MTAPTTPKLERCVLATLLALITLHTYFRLSRSLWLDELLTAWITKGTFSTAFLLPWNYQGQSPVAFVVVWLTRQLLGSSELALRLPSFLLSIVTLLAVYKIGMILWQKQIGIRAALLCCVVTPLTISLDARPYAMALCAYGWSLYFFILWLKNPTERLLGTTTLLALATLYSHPLFALAYVPFLLGALWVAPHRKFSLIAWLGIGLLALMPLAHQLLALSAKQPVYTWLPTLSWGRIYLSLCPFPVIGLLIVFTASFYLGVQEGEKPIKEPMLKLLPALYLTPLLLAFILDYFDLLRIFTPRYVLYSYIPLCLLLAWLSHLLRPLMFYGTLTILLGLHFVFRNPFVDEGFREAVATAQSHADTVLLASGLAEANSIEWLSHSHQIDFLSAPVTHYWASAKVKIVPSVLDNGPLDIYLDSILSDVCTQTESISLISRTAPSSLLQRIQDRLQACNFSASDPVEKFGSIAVHKYKKIHLEISK